MALPAARTMVAMARDMSPEAAGAAASVIGAIAAMLPGKSRSVFRINRKHVMVPNGLEASLRNVYGNLARGMLDFLRLNEVSDDVFRDAVEVRGDRYMSEALEKGRGVLAITAHYSAWELIPRAVSLQGHSVGVVTRKVGRGSTARFVDGLRARHGTVTIDRGSGLARLMRVLRDNVAVGILIDQDTMGVESDFVDFLGLPARTPTGPAQLALRFDIPVLTLHISGKGTGRYLVEIDSPVELEGYRRGGGALELTQDLTSRIGEWVIEDPEQWIWVHERWARRPGWAPGLR